MATSDGAGLPEMMRAIGFAAPGGPDVLHIIESPLPRLRPDDVLIRVAYAGVNRPDCLQRAGAYRHRPVPRRCWGWRYRAKWLRLAGKSRVR